MDGKLKDQYLQDQLPIHRFISYRVLRLHSKLNAQAARILKETCGLSLAQWRVVAVVATEDGITPSKISRFSQMDKGQLSRCVKALVDSGLMVTRDDPADQRIQHLSLTAKGHEIHERTLPRMLNRQDRLLLGLSDVEREVIFSAFDKLEVIADAADDPADE
ncbi:MarR family winged helix-turn-helix transcriptional regulator [Aliishimia ponticola]|nr:MarR family transcriptional regulator [Aliishimia ponticola]